MVSLRVASLFALLAASGCISAAQDPGTTEDHLKGSQSPSPNCGPSSCKDGEVACGNACCPATAAAKIASGDHDTCVVTYGGAVKCWGSNYYGQLGDGTAVPSYVPVASSGWSSDVTDVAVGYMHVCALKKAGGVECLGFNNSQQLGDGTNNDSKAPVQVGGLTSPVTAIFAGSANSFAIASDGTAWGWGDNHMSQLGVFNGTKAVTALSSGVRALAAGNLFVCALTTGGGVKCLGSNTSGQLGNDSWDTASSASVDVATLSSGVTAIAAGDSHACAITADGSAQCWGENRYGQLGIGTMGVNTGARTPTTATSGVKAIAAGLAHTCAITGAGGVVCWGANSHGQLGDNTTNDSAVPVAVSGLSSGATAIAVERSYSCAITSGGHVMCWGYQENGGGEFPTSQNNLPVAIDGF